MLKLIRAIAILTLALIPAGAIADSAATGAGPHATVSPLPAKAAGNPAQSLQLVPVIFLPKSGWSGAAGGGVVHKAQDLECHACRQICVEDYKVDCDESERRCRRMFVRCMRYCWDNVCR